MKKIELSQIKYNYGKFYVKSPSEGLQEMNLSGYAKLEDLADVATSGDYADLSNKPTIPTKTSDLNNDSNFLTSHLDISGKANTNDLATVATTGDYDDLLNKPTIPTIPANVSAFNNDAGYLTEHQDISGKANTTDLVGVAYFSDDSGEGIVPSDGIYVETINSSASISVNPDVLTMINGSVGTSTITFQVPLDNLAHVWSIMMETSSSVNITFAMSNNATIKKPIDFIVRASKDCEIRVIGKGTKFYLAYGEFT